VPHKSSAEETAAQALTALGALGALVRRDVIGLALPIRGPAGYWQRSLT